MPDRCLPECSGSHSFPPARSAVPGTASAPITGQCSSNGWIPFFHKVRSPFPGIVPYLKRTILSGGQQPLFWEAVPSRVWGSLAFQMRYRTFWLDQSDKYMKEDKAGFEKGRKRAILKSYARTGDKRHRLVEKISKAQNQEARQTLIAELKEFDKIYHAMPRSDAMDTSFRRVQYTRYADVQNFCLQGPNHEKKNITLIRISECVIRTGKAGNEYA